MKGPWISSILTACLLGVITHTSAGVSPRTLQQAQQNPPKPQQNQSADNGKAPKDPSARYIPPQQIKAPADSTSLLTWKPADNTVPQPPSRVERPNVKDPTVNPEPQKDLAPLPPLTFPRENETTSPGISDSQVNQPSMPTDAFVAAHTGVLRFLLTGVGGMLAGLALSFPALWFFNRKLWSKRPNRDLMRWEKNAHELDAKRKALADARIEALTEAQSIVLSATQHEALERAFTMEVSRLTDSDYALNGGYVSYDQLKRLRSSSLAISEMSFALAIIGVAAAISFGIDGWADGLTVGIMAAVIVFGFTLLGVERYHKYRSSYKTVVLGQFQERATVKPDGQNSFRVVLVPPSEKPGEGEATQ